MTSITSMSSRGQVVIPLGIREMMGLKEGEKFAISGNQDTIVLKKLRIQKFDELIKETREFARKNKITQKDLNEVIKRVRAEERRSSRH